MLPGQTALEDLLRRHPWSGSALLARVLPALAAALPAQLAGIQQVEVPGAGLCYALRDQAPESLAGVWRWRLARAFALQAMGPAALLAGCSPAGAADGQFWWQARWWRVWVDLGSCAPEALALARHAPRWYGPQVQDVVLTTRRARLGLLVAQIERHFCGPARVTVWLLGAQHYRVAHPERAAPPAARAEPCPPAPPAPRRTRPRRQAIARGRLVARLAAADWDGLIQVGNNPLLTAAELAFLFARGLAGQARLQAGLTRLQALGLVTPRESEGQARLVLAGPALDLLAAYWGVARADMLRFLPWPQRRAPGGQLCYALDRLLALAAHNRLVRQFALALQDNSRRVSNAQGGLLVVLETLVGSRLLYPAPDGQRMHWLVPDAALRAQFWTATPGAGGAQERQEPEAREAATLLLEVDRATNPLSRLKARLDGYARLWASLEREQQAQLVWVIAGTPYREGQILAAMRARGIRGWTVTLARLVLAENDGWWHAPPAGGLEMDYAALGGMAPLRAIWRTTATDGLVPFLGQQPWHAPGARKEQDADGRAAAVAGAG